MLDKNGYSLKPQNISDNFWYYEEKSGVTCYFTGGHQWTIPWRLLDRTFERRRTAKAKIAIKRKKK